MSQFLDALVGKLPVRVQPYAKAVVPLVLGVAAAGADLAISGEEVRQLAELGGGVLTSAIVLAVPNRD